MLPRASRALLVAACVAAFAALASAQTCEPRVPSIASDGISGANGMGTGRWSCVCALSTALTLCWPADQVALGNELLGPSSGFQGRVYLTAPSAGLICGWGPLGRPPTAPTPCWVHLMATRGLGADMREAPTDVALAPGA